MRPALTTAAALALAAQADTGLAQVDTAAVGTVAAPDSARAARGAPVAGAAGATRPPAPPRVPRNAPRGAAAEIRAASRYAEWGLVAGSVLGLAYGLTYAPHGALRPPFVMFDVLVGSVAGGAGGAAVYVVRRVTGHPRE